VRVIDTAVGSFSNDNKSKISRRCFVAGRGQGRELRVKRAHQRPATAMIAASRLDVKSALHGVRTAIVVRAAQATGVKGLGRNSQSQGSKYAHQQQDK